MSETIDKNLNIHEILKQKIGIFKDAFIEYYGEQDREYIEHKFSNLTTVGYIPIDDIDTYIRSIESETSNKLLSTVNIEQLGLAEKDVYGNSGLEFYSIMPIGQCEKFIDLIRVEKEERLHEYQNKGFNYLENYIDGMTREEYDEACEKEELPDWANDIPLWLKNNFTYYITGDGYKDYLKNSFNSAKPLLEKIYPGITLENFDEKIEEKPEIISLLIEVNDKVKLCEKEYQKQKETYKKLYDLKEEKTNKRTELLKMYHKKFILENIEYLPEDLRLSTIKCIEENKMFNFSDIVRSYFGYGIYDSLNVEAFTTESEEKLNKESTASYIKNSIKKSRIRFYKQNGIDLGDDYEAYLNSKEAKKVTPSQEKADMLKSNQEKIQNQFNNSLYTSLSGFKNIREEIDQLNLIVKDDGIDATMDALKITCVYPNIIETPNGTELFPVVIIVPDKDGKYTDHKIVHELNHVMELFLLEKNDTKIQAICGWDSLNSDIARPDIVDTIPKQKNDRKYEAFNEVINELIAQEISEIMQKNGQYVFDNPEISGFKGYTSYERSAFIIRDFFNEFKDAIKKSRRNGNMEIIYDEVGKENFDELNEIFHSFKEEFNEFTWFDAVKQFQEKQDTEAAKKVQDILTKRNKVLDKMRMYSAQKESKIKPEENQNTIQI